MDSDAPRLPFVLANHLADVLRACRERNTTETKPLATHLGLTPATVNVYFQRIAEALGTTDRFSSVQRAYRMGLLEHHEDNLLVNGDFLEGFQGRGPGSSMPWSTVIGWNALARSTPQWVSPEMDGGTAAVMLWGAADTGEAIWQSLPPSRRISPGRTYRFTAEYRFGPVRRDWPTVPRQPMFVEFVVRASQSPLPAYTTPDEPGRVVTIGRLRYERREPESVIAPHKPLTPEAIEELRRHGGEVGEHAVQNELAVHRAGGYHFWAWEWGALPNWVSDSTYDTLTIHPTNGLVVGTDGSNRDAPEEIAWGQIRRVRLVEIPAFPDAR